MLIYTYIHTYIYIFNIRFPNKNNNVTVGHESSARLAEDGIAPILLNILIKYVQYLCM